jgi:hypothetical protein
MVMKSSLLLATRQEMPLGNHVLLILPHIDCDEKYMLVDGGRKEERGKVASRHQRKWLAANGILRWGLLRVNT